MTLANDDIPQRLKGYASRSLIYLQNAHAFLEQNEVEKASEFLWGSMAQAIKAVAAFKAVELPSHGAIWTYTRELSRELRDQTLFEAFRDANFLHHNFYESGLTREVVLTFEESIRYTVGKLLSIIPPEVLEQ
jgi:hypothetical protein